MSDLSSTNDDVCVRGLALGRTVRLIAVNCTQLGERLRTAHDAGPLGTVALGRAACASILLSVTLKDRQQVGVQINGEGPIGEIYAISDWMGRVRATVGDPRVALEAGQSLDDGLAKAVGPGRFSIIRQLTDGAPYRGVVPLVSGRIADDLAHYLLTSEQIHSAVALGEKLSKNGVKTMGGLMLQAMPGCDDAAVAELVERFESVASIGEALDGVDDVADILRGLADDFELVDRRPISFHCPCSREQFARRLCALGENDLRTLTDNEEDATAVCHFCGAQYVFNREQLNALLYGARMYDEAESD